MELILLILFLLIYFIPSIVAVKRNQRNTPAIITLNILLGWTVLGWIISLVWSMLKNNDGDFPNQSCKFWPEDGPICDAGSDVSGEYKCTKNDEHKCEWSKKLKRHLKPVNVKI